MDAYNTEGSFLGIGFSHGGEEAPTLSSAVDTADSLMKHYLQQCLDFHNDQQQHKQQDEEVTVPQFVTAQYSLPPSAGSELAPPPRTRFPSGSVSSSSVASSVMSDPVLSHPSPREAIAKARAIVQKFQQQKHHSPLSGASMLPADYRHRRQQQLEKEHERLHKATLKNFEYVARREEERLNQQLAQLEETKILERQLQEQQAAFLLSRREKQNLSKAGIGTSRRQALEKAKQQKGHTVKLNYDLSIAIYLSGFSREVTEDFLRQLFSSYGAIRSVHLYRHKQTGELKGDALVVYNVRKVSEKQEVLDTVCSQVSQASLGKRMIEFIDAMLGTKFILERSVGYSILTSFGFR